MKQIISTKPYCISSLVTKSSIKQLKIDVSGLTNHAVIDGNDVRNPCLTYIIPGVKKAEPSIYPELLKNSNKVYKLIAENMSKKGLLGDIGEIGFKTSKVINGLFDVKEGTLGILDKATNAPKAFQGGVETIEAIRGKSIQGLEGLISTRL